MIYAIDLDGTLCEETHLGDDTKDWHAYYDHAVPIPKAITLINKLYEAGHQIFIYTARWKVDEEITKEWLAKQGVKYDGLIMGKLRANVYVDNDAITIEKLEKQQKNFKG